MAIIPGSLIQIRISKRAQEIIDRMIAVRAARWEFRINRKQFLLQWGKLRKAMRLTPDYQSFIDRVKLRADGKCELCSRRGAHVHHKIPVAHDPKLCLTDSNAMYVCRRCHSAEHKKIDSVTARRRPPTHTGPDNHIRLVRSRSDKPKGNSSRSLPTISAPTPPQVMPDG